MKRNNTIVGLILILSLFLVQGCSKEKVQEDLIVQAMTSGRWIVVQLTDAGSDYSADFSPFEFQFLENRTVQAINGSTVITGTWVGDATTRTITTNFPGNNTTLNRLNDTWKIFNNSFTLVEANPANTARSAYLKLNKR